MPLHTRKQCWQPSQRIFHWRLKSLPPLSESYEKTLFSETKFPPKMFLWKRILPDRKPRGASAKKTRKLCVEWPERITIFFPFPNTFSAESFLFTRNTQCSQPCHRKFAIRLKKIRLVSENDEKFIFYKKEHFLSKYPKVSRVVLSWMSKIDNEILLQE